MTNGSALSVQVREAPRSNFTAFFLESDLRIPGRDALSKGWLRVTSLHRGECPRSCRPEYCRTSFIEEDSRRCLIANH